MNPPNDGNCGTCAHSSYLEPNAHPGIGQCNWTPEGIALPRWFEGLLGNPFVLMTMPTPPCPCYTPAERDTLAEKGL